MSMRLVLVGCSKSVVVNISTTNLTLSIRYVLVSCSKSMVVNVSTASQALNPEHEVVPSFAVEFCEIAQTLSMR